MNLGSVLKEEIIRLSRKTAKQATDPMRASLLAQRKAIAALKKELSVLRQEQAKLRKSMGRSPQTEDVGRESRYSSKSLKSQRARLGLSSEHFGKLIGVSSQTIYNLERNPDQRPRQNVVAGLALVRKLGRRKAADRLAELGVSIAKRR